MHGLVESGGCFGLWCAADGLLQVRVGVGVVKLDGLNPAKIVVVSSILRVGSRPGEGGLGDKLVRWVIQAIQDIAPKQTINEGSLSFVIVPQ